MSYGPITWRSITAPLKFGASSVYPSMIRSRVLLELVAVRLARSSRRGTHWVNIEKTCTPSGASFLSSVVGIVPSTNGRDRGLALDVRVLERALRVLRREAQLDGPGVVVLLVLAGHRGEVGQLATAPR